MNEVNLTPSEFSPLDEEELVAYLDGELDDAACERVERRLAADAEYRRELRRLERTWDCLDQLPETQVDEIFTRSTIEMVALAASQEIEQTRQTAPRRRLARAILLAGGLFLALLVGFAATTALWPDPTRQLVRDLPLLEHLEQYRSLDDVEFLRALAAAGLFADAPAPSSRAATAFPPHESDDWNDRRRWVRELPPDGKADLLNSQKRFNALAPEEQARVRRLHETITADPQAAELQATLTKYHAWLSELSAGGRADLLALDTDGRLAKIEEIRRRQQIAQTRTLSQADTEALYAWLETQVRAQRDKLLARIPRERRRHFDHDREARRHLILMTIAWRKSRFNARPPLLDALDAETIEQVLARLSPEAHAKLRGADSADARRQLVQAWIQYALDQKKVVQRAFGHRLPSLTNEELETFFEQGLTSDQRAELLDLPAEEMQRELRRLYFQGDEFDGRRRGGEGVRGRRGE
jgi:hypothetical protein